MFDVTSVWDCDEEQNSLSNALFGGLPKKKAGYGNKSGENKRKNLKRKKKLEKKKSKQIKHTDTEGVGTVDCCKDISDNELDQMDKCHLKNEREVNIDCTELHGIKKRKKKKALEKNVKSKDDLEGKCKESCNVENIDKKETIKEQSNQVLADKRFIKIFDGGDNLDFENNELENKVEAKKIYTKVIEVNKKNENSKRKEDCTAKLNSKGKKKKKLRNLESRGKDEFSEKEYSQEHIVSNSFQEDPCENISPQIVVSHDSTTKSISNFRLQRSSKYNKFQQKMEGKLKGAQFRWINEKLYSSDSSEAVELFSSDPSLYNLYHDGYHSQVQQWPQNPVEVIVENIKSRSKALVIADFGCGDAKIARGVPNKVHSFDLIATNEYVIACDMAKVPLANGSVDIAVFCLSLMGTNLVDFLCEAKRTLKMDGTLIIAEVKSRFDDVDEFIQNVSSLGFTLNDMSDSNKMFILLEFQKTSNHLSKINVKMKLKPCIYKRR